MKKVLLSLFIIFAFVLNVNAQVVDTTINNHENRNDTISVGNPEESQVYKMAEIMPEYPGGMSKLYEYLCMQIRYPQGARDANIQGKVFVSFIVEKDGSISNIKVIKEAHPELDQEAVRVIQNMPNWNPGKQNGEPVRVEYVLPVSFKTVVPKL